MVKRLFFCWIIFLISQVEGFDIKLEGNSEYIELGLNEFNACSSAEQIAILKEMKITLDPTVLQALFNQFNEEGKRSYLKKLLEPYEASERQALLNELLNPADYKTQLTNLSPDECIEIGTLSNPDFFGALPIVDWLNCLNFPSFFQPDLKNALINREHFNAFNSLDQIEAWIEPYGYYTSFNRGSDSLDFDLYTVGISLGGGYTLRERFVLGFGLGYSHSEIDWKKNQSTQGSLNTFYFGPTLSYLFPYGYFHAMLLGAANFYHINRETKLFQEWKKAASDPSTWDLDARLEGGLCFPIGYTWYLYPLAAADFVNVFSQKTIESLDKETNLIIKPLHESFLRWKAGLKMSSEVFKEGFGFITPHFAIGLAGYIPLLQSTYSYDLDGCSKTFEEEVAVDHWSQYFFEAGLSLFHERGIFLSLNYQLYTGYNSPIHFGNIRLGWSW